MSTPTQQSHDELWQSIEVSPFRQAYLQELYSLSHQVVSLTEEVFRAAPKPTTSDEFLHVDQAVIQGLFSALGAAARIKALVGERPRRKSQDALEYEIQLRLRRRRVEDDVSLTAIRDRDPASPSNEP